MGFISLAKTFSTNGAASHEDPIKLAPHLQNLAQDFARWHHPPKNRDIQPNHEGDTVVHNCRILATSRCQKVYSRRIKFLISPCFTPLLEPSSFFSPSGFISPLKKTLIRSSSSVMQIYFRSNAQKKQPMGNEHKIFGRDFLEN